MENIHFSDNIPARGRKLHLQTHTLDEESKIVSTLFDGGRVLARDETGYEPNLPKTILKETVQQFHQERIQAIEILYVISARVKTVRHPVSLFKLGRQYLRWNLIDEAISEFELAIDYNPNMGEAYIQLGEAYLRRGGFTEAIETLKKGLQVTPGYPDLWLKLGAALGKTGNFNQALAAVKKAQKINPEYSDAYFLHARLLLSCISDDSGKKVETDLPTAKNTIKASLSQAVSLSPRFRTPLLEEALRRLNQGQLKESGNLLDRLGEKLNPEMDLNFHDLFYLNYMYGEKGRHPAAVDAYVSQLERLLKKHARYADLHNMMGIGYLMKCRELFFRSLQHFRTAVEINPDYQQAKRNLKLAENDGKGLLILLRALLK
ncbi:MAG TPA: tetratricopeptide repeat protein [bacterium]|nr:tetratricopeptide repeat protein [bacterium]